MIGLIVLFSMPGLLVLTDFVRFIITGKRLYTDIVEKVLELIVIIGIPLFYLTFQDFIVVNDCCSDSATFSPEHRLSIYTLISICMITFFYSSRRKNIAPPLIEIIVNSILILGIILNIFISLHVMPPLWLIGNLAPILLFIMSLAENQKKVISTIQNNATIQRSGFEKFLWKILSQKLIIKIPVLFVLALPILILISSFLMLFGQKPDSMISAFTDTYKHGLSQLDYLCDNVDCGGHFLCSVAAKGHKELVKPQRLGIRASKPIVCNRQLLIANAFEELIKQNTPLLHKIIRRNYNRVGNMIHKHYSVFNNKIVADCIYLLMKPLEWFFLITLYLFDRNPENRIEMQYLDSKDRKCINNIVKTK